MAIRVLAPFGDPPVVSLDKKKKQTDPGKMSETDNYLLDKCNIKKMY